MHERKLGPFSVSAIGLGCMNMSSGYGPADDETSIRLLQESLDAGYTFLDTARLYGNGHNEELIGKALSHRRDEFVLATKCGIYSDEQGKTQTNGRPDVIRTSCEDSLRRLSTDVIDLYYLHRRDKQVPLEESIGEMSRLVEEGKVQTLGISEVSSENLRLAHSVHPMTALQSEYSLWSRTPERKILDVCEELGVTFVPFSPLARQFLTGKAQDNSQLNDNDIRCTIARPRFEPDAFAQNIKLLEPYAEIAKQQDCSMAQLALAWLLAQRDKTMIPIPGTKHIEYMRENAGAGDIQLTQDVVEQLDELINENTIVGRRYVDAGMENSDAELD